MKISRVELTNHAVVPDLEVEVREHLVLVGSNEVGKSSLLRLLDAAIHGSLGALHGRLSLDSLRDPDQGLRLLVRFQEFETHEKAALPDQIEVLPDGDLQLTLVVNATKNVGTEDISIERYFLKPGLQVPASTAALSAVPWTFLPAGRSPDRELGVGQASAMRRLLGSVDLGDAIDVIVQAVDGLHEAVHSSAALTELRSELATSLSRLLPRAVQPDDIVLELPRTDAEEPLGDVDVKLRHNYQVRPLRLQSDGVRSLSTVAIQLMVAGAQIVAVDEPEIHLHPRAQAQIAAMLRSRSGQALIATHSTAVLNKFSPMDTLVFAAEGCRQLTSEPFDDAPKMKEHWWTASVLEPLTSRGVILVEGISDRVLVEAVARSTGRDLDRLGISVVEVNGATNFKMPIRLFGAHGFGIPLGGLVDLNEAADAASYLDTTVAALTSSGFFVSTPDLEAECVDLLGIQRHIEMLLGSGLFTETSILKSQAVSNLADITPEAHTEWCGKNRKIHVAMALASQMTSADAALLTTLTSAIDHLVARLA